MREIKFSPERYLPESTDWSAEEKSQVAQFIAEKETLLAIVQAGETPTATWHQQLAQINQQLQAFTANSREQLKKQRQKLESAAKYRSLLGSREFSFCLFPQKTLSPLLLALSREGL